VLRQDGGAVDIRYRRLDVGERESVDEFVEWIGEEHGIEGTEGRQGGSGLTALINNAGVWEGDEIGKWTVTVLREIDFVREYKCPRRKISREQHRDQVVRQTKLNRHVRRCNDNFYDPHHKLPRPSLPLPTPPPAPPPLLHL